MKQFFSTAKRGMENKWSAGRKDPTPLVPSHTAREPTPNGRRGSAAPPVFCPVGTKTVIDTTTTNQVAMTVAASSSQGNAKGTQGYGNVAQDCAIAQ